MSRALAHAINASVRCLPRCPECDAAERTPCVTEKGFMREPHVSRERLASGQIFVIHADDARRRRMLRAVSELAATMPRRARR